MQLRIHTDPPKQVLGIQADPGFGKCFTPAMLQISYEPEQGWHQPRLIARGDLDLDPAAIVLHYGQSVFEGLKAYRSPEGKPVIFRVQAHAERLVRSAQRMAMAPLPPKLFVEAVTAFVQHQFPALSDDPGHALYLRPLIIGTEAALGVRASQNYDFLVLGMIVSSYFSKRTAGLKLLVSESYVRAVRGGTGAAKTAGNYAASLLAQREAVAAGCDQVLWLDAIERRYIEELGGMNFIAVIDGQLVTPPLSDTILAGVTRDSILQLARRRGMTVVERPIEISELLDGIQSGRTQEAFACGTAAVIAPIAELVYQDETYRLPDDHPIADSLRTELVGIQRGVEPDTFGWVTQVAAEPTAV